MSFDSQTKAARLLRVLLLRFGRMSVEASREWLLLIWFRPGAARPSWSETEDEMHEDNLTLRDEVSALFERAYQERDYLLAE